MAASRLASLRPADVLFTLAAAAVIIAVALGVSFYIAAPIYAFFFIAITIARPPLALALMMATIPFVQDLGLGPVKIAIGEINLILSLVPLLLLRRHISFYSPFWIAALIYFFVCILSTVQNGMDAYDAVALFQMVVYLFLATFAFSRLFRDIPAIRLGLYAMLLVDAGLAVILIVSDSQYVLGYHKNGIGDQMCFAVLCAAGLWWTSTGKQRIVASILLAVTSGGLLFSLSRGSWAGALFGGMVMVALTNGWRPAVKLVLFAAPIVILAWFSLPSEQRDYASGFSRDRSNIQARYNNFDSAMTEFRKSPILGIGVGYRKRADATNLFAFVLAETGIVGLAAFVVLLGTFARMAWVVKRRLSPTDPLFALFVIGTGLMAAKIGHAMFDHYWQRGTLPVWIGAGLVLQAYQKVTNRRFGSRVQNAKKISRLPVPQHLNPA